MIQAKKWEEKEIDILKNEYQNKTNKQLAEMLNRTPKSIEVKLRKLGLKRMELYNYKRDFFQNIDTEEKAYWLGFIYADGWIYKNINEHGSVYDIGIELQKGDDLHLKKFNKSLNGNLKIKYRTRFKKEFDKYTTTCYIRCYSKKMYDDLSNLGITQNKTYNDFNLPKLDKELMRHFLRGYFDGDGCIQRVKYNKEYVFVCDYCSVNYDLLNQIRDYLFYNHNIKSYIRLEKRNVKSNLKSNVPSYRLVFAGMINSYNFLCYIYNNSNIYLDRKYNYFITKSKEYNIEERIIKTIKANKGMRNT